MTNFVVPSGSLQFHDISAWVTSGNEILENFDLDGTSEQCHVTCWIGSKPGEAFTITWNNARRDFALDGTLYVDGVMYAQYMMLDSLTRPHECWNTISISSAWSSQLTQRTFVFPRPATATGTSDPGAVPRGEIRLEIWRLQIVELISQPGQVALEQGAAGTLGPEVASDTVLVDLAWARRLGDSPYVTFTFKYAPIEYLRAEGIALPVFRFRYDPFTEERISTGEAGPGPSTSSARRQLAKRERRQHKLAGRSSSSC